MERMENEGIVGAANPRREARNPVGGDEEERF